MLHRRPRAALLALAASLTATLMAGIVPAAAATDTWYVAPPGPIAAGGSGCASPDFTDLQSAVDASGVRATRSSCATACTTSITCSSGARDTAA